MCGVTLSNTQQLTDHKNEVRYLFGNNAYCKLSIGKSSWRNNKIFKNGKHAFDRFVVENLKHLDYFSVIG